MGMSKQTTFMLACAVVLSALVPGVAGYLSGRLEAIETAERNLRALEARLDVREARGVRPALAAPCQRTQEESQLQETPATALGENRSESTSQRRWARDVSAWLEEVEQADRDQTPYLGDHDPS
ncbi:hypothetical protein SAMN05421874_12456 [Nonomuraea maritima]|uniref:Uncharacterized protein n=2 Tax=Nonomuraea maritima TaxID=683260 RepID=A0A1G9L7C4_9ACTN|nr:hypothetical protein SAMN05421874_12456 [Nonomuraea maritima]